MTVDGWRRRVWCAVGSGLAGTAVLALVGLVLLAVAVATRLALGVDVT
jgi:hypothetical protein